MISPAGEGDPTLRTANFLKPCLTSVSSLSSPSLLPLPTTFDPKKWPLSVNFHGWRNPMKVWKPWAEKMAALHEATWRKAGIYEAVLNSTYRINRSDDLVLGLAERWCPETNSFVFPWGEATITLEDVVVLSGHSVLGCPVFSPLGTEESLAVQDKLIQSRREIVRTSANKAAHNSWVKKFMDGGSEIEHEAFLALWLSRFVMVTSYDVISQNSFPIAVMLARGTRIALAPVVLASIYRDLSLLREKVAALAASDFDDAGNGDKGHHALAVTIWSPFQLVQVWVWERFPDLQPKPNVIKGGEPRLARWDNVKSKVKNEDMRLLLDSAKESFIWRPYAKALKNWSFPKFYAETENRLLVGCGSDEALLSFVRFLRVSELVGLDCIEQYLPQRVAMQFGIDQDVPGSVPRHNGSPEIAWSCYDHSISELLCYVPSRLFEADVTTRYSKWWNSSVMVPQSTNSRFLQQQKKSASPRMSIKNLTDQKMDARKGDTFISSFEIMPKSAQERNAASFVKRFKTPLSNSKDKRKGGPCPGFKMTPKDLNGSKSGITSISSFKITPKSLKASANDQKAIKLYNFPGFWKKNSKKMAGSSGQENRRGDTRLGPSFTCEILKEPAMNSKGNKSPVQEQLTPCMSPSSLKRKGGENCDFSSATAPKTAKMSVIGVAGKKVRNEIVNCPVPPGFPPRNPAQCNQFKASDCSEDDQLTIAEVLKSSVKQQSVETKRDKDVENASFLSLSQPSLEDNGALKVVELRTRSVEHKENRALETRRGGDAENSLGPSHNLSSSTGYDAAPKRAEAMTTALENSAEAVENREGGNHLTTSGQFENCSSAAKDHQDDLQILRCVEKAGHNESTRMGSKQNAGFPALSNMSLNGFTIEVPGLELEARIKRLEDDFAKLKAKMLQKKVVH